MHPDLDEARSLHAGLKAILDRHLGETADYRTLRRVLDLCRKARVAIDDRYCHEKLRLVEDFAAEMFSHGESRAQFLKQRILDALELFHSRLYSIEVMRRAAARAARASVAAALRT